MSERRLFIYKRSFKGNRSRVTGEYVARDLRDASQNSLWRPSEHPEKREPFAWEYSVYYWWWEFLRRHEGYRLCCQNGGKGKFAKLYADWGDIHACEYWTWWNQKVVDDAGETWTRGEYLFAEPLRSINVLEEGTADQSMSSSLHISVPLEVGTRDLVKMFRRVLNQQSKRRSDARSLSRALYPVAAKAPLRALFWALRAWDVEQASMTSKLKVKNHQKAELMGLPFLDLESDTGKQRARMDFKRYLKAAEDYIYYAVEEGTFPKQRTNKSERNKPAN